MAESVFGKPIDNAIQEINDKIGTVPSGETVEGQIDALNSKIENTDWADLISGVEYRKKNGFVQVYFNCAVSLTSTFTAFATLPDGFRPKKLCYFRLLGSNANSQATVLVRTDGIIMGRVDSGTGTAVNGLITF